MTQSVTINESQPERVNLNYCTRYELLDLPGIGEILADRIIENRPYSDIWEILDINGMGYGTFKGISDRIEV